MNTMKTMKTVAALALVTGNVHAAAFAQAFENSMAAQAKIDHEMEQDLRQKYGLPNGKGIVLVSSHYISVSADYGCSWQGMDHDLNAKRIAIWGLLANPSGEYFNATIRDNKGEGRAFIQRPADKGTLLDMLNETIQQIEAEKARTRRS
jgi:hypothetical protein